MLFDWPGGWVGLLGSLSVEEQFYLVWPWIVRWATPRSLLRMVGLVLVGAPALRCALSLLEMPWTWNYVFTLCRADSLVAGAGVLLVRSNLDAARLRLGALGVFFVMGAVAGYVASLNPTFYDSRMQIVGDSAFALFFAACLLLSLLASPKSFLARVLSQRFLLFFGKYSYGLYLLHELAKRLLFHWGLLARPQASQTVGAAALTQLALYVGATAGAVALAWLSYHLVEKRCLAFRSRFGGHGQ